MLVGRAQARWADRVTRGSVPWEGRRMRTNAAPTATVEAFGPGGGGEGVDRLRRRAMQAPAVRRRRYRWRATRRPAMVGLVLILLLLGALGRESEPSSTAPVPTPMAAARLARDAGPASRMDLAAGIAAAGAAAGGDEAAASPVRGLGAVDRVDGDGAVQVVVRPGDTLWEVAQRLGPPGRDPREGVAAIMEASGLSTAALRPGMVLTVPADWVGR